MVSHITHYNDVIMSAMASQITSLTIVYSMVYSGADQRKYKSSASLTFVRWILNTSGNELLFHYDFLMERPTYRINFDQVTVIHTRYFDYVTQGNFRSKNSKLTSEITQFINIFQSQLYTRTGTWMATIPSHHQAWSSAKSFTFIHSGIIHIVRLLLCVPVAMYWLVLLTGFNVTSVELG